MLIILPIVTTIVLFALAYYLVYISNANSSNVASGLGGLLDYAVYYGSATLISISVWFLWAMFK